MVLTHRQQSNPELLAALLPPFAHDELSECFVLLLLFFEDFQDTGRVPSEIWLHLLLQDLLFCFLDHFSEHESQQEPERHRLQPCMQLRAVSPTIYELGEDGRMADRNDFSYKILHRRRQPICLQSVKNLQSGGDHYYSWLLLYLIPHFLLIYLIFHK